MNRDILFKGKRVSNGEWVEGNLLQTTAVASKSFIVPSACYTFDKWDWAEWLHVYPETICQYTGLTDKDGNKIWENDIVAYLDTYSTESGYAESNCIGQVVWDNETLSFQVTERLSAESYEVLDECSVIGNIFDEGSENIGKGADE